MAAACGKELSLPCITAVNRSIGYFIAALKYSLIFVPIMITSHQEFFVRPVPPALPDHDHFGLRRLPPYLNRTLL